MAICKREGPHGTTWQIDYLDPNGNRVRQFFKKKGEAVAGLGKRVFLKAEGRYLDKKKDYVATFWDLVGKYTENFQDQAYFKSSKKYLMSGFLDYFG